jgi:flagella basal body P-ring formation protein FlgA
MIAPLLALSLVWAAPSAKAKDLRARIDKLYEALQTPSMRLSAQPRLLTDSVRGPEGATGWKVVRDGGSRPVGTEAVVLVWSSADNPSLRRDWLQVRVERKELVALARTRLERGDRLDSARVDWQWRPTSGMRAAPPSPDSLDKLRTRTGISPGQAIWRNQLERLPVFQRGDLVLVQAGGRGASATLQAQAIDDGIPGAKTRVKSPFGKTLVGTTGADGTVKVP